MEFEQVIAALKMRISTRTLQSLELVPALGILRLVGMCGILTRVDGAGFIDDLYCALART